jgi:beta-glucosidase
MYRHIAAVTCFMLACQQPATAQTCSKTDPLIEKRVDDLLSRMTLDEKISQMRIFHAKSDHRLVAGKAAMNLDSNGKLVLPDAQAARFQNGIAGIKNPGEHNDPVTAAKLTNALQARIITASPNRIPALFVAEAYNGLDAQGSTRFARPIVMASSWNPQLVEQVWDVVGREARLRGFHMIHSPVGDIHRDPRFGRMSEGFGEDTELASHMVTSAVLGVQGGLKGPGTTHIGAVTKHFVGYGQVDGGRNFASVNVSPRDLEDQLLPPFHAAVTKACTLGIMPSHGDINGVASHGSAWLLRKKLREEWGFNGYVVSDAEDVARLGFFMGVAENDDEAAKLGLLAGVDIDLYSDRAYANLPRLAQADPTLLPLVDDAVRRVLRVKFKLDLFDKPYVKPAATAKGTRTKAAQALALALDLEAAILLKNANNVLPLDKGRKQKIALIGPLLEEGTETIFRQHFKNADFVSERALELTTRDELTPQLIPDADNAASLERAIDQARTADVAIVFIGDTKYTAKEAYFHADTRGDRASLDPVGQQDELVRRIKALGKPVIIVLRHRRTLSIGAISQSADAILDVWEQGERGDEALALLLSGDANPSGRLPVSVPRHVGQLPIHYAQKRINFRKNYLFEKDGPLYPFGFGLSYTNFRYENLRLSGNEMRPGQPLLVDVDVTNTGARAGKEVVQLYISDPAAHVTRPVKELKAFEKVGLAAGEKRTIRFTVTPDMLHHSGVDMEVDPGYGAFKIEVAPSAANGGLTAEAKNIP